MHQFNPVDAALLYLERPNTPFHVGMLTVYDPSTCPKKRPGFHDIVEAVRKCLPGAPSFRRKIVRVPMDLDYPYWIEDEHFDLEFHMRHLSLPRPGNWQQFRTQVSRLISAPLDLSRAPWEMWVIEGLDAIEGFPPGCFAILLKIHHCAIDGQAGVALLSLLNQDAPNKKPRKLRDNWEPEQAPSNRLLLRKAWLNGIRRPTEIVQKLFSNASDLVRVALDDVHSEEEGEGHEAPHTMLSGRVSAHRVFDDVICEFADIREVRKRVEGATINDVCLAVVAEGLRRYLDAHDALPGESLVTTVPIATRSLQEATAGGNQISITTVALRTDIADPIKRLQAITAETSRKKAMQDGVVMKTVLDVVYNLPGMLVGLAARTVPLMIARADDAAGLPNTMVTNVPGPAKPMYFLGAEMVHTTGFSPMMDGGGIMHSVSSFRDKFLFSFIGCRDLLEDADFYRDCLEEGVKAVISAAKNKKT